VHPEGHRSALDCGATRIAPGNVPLGHRASAGHFAKPVARIAEDRDSFGVAVRGHEDLKENDRIVNLCTVGFCRERALVPVVG